MPVVKDIQLTFLKRKERISNIETLKLTSSSNYDEDTSFFKETRCITSLYWRYIPKLRTDYEKGILIHCVDDISLLNQWEKEYRTFPEYINVFVEFGNEQNFSDLPDRKKKELALQIIHSEMKNLAVKYDWDVEELEKVYNKIMELDYKNELVYIKKNSPNKKYVCNIVCQHEVSYVDIYLEIREFRTKRLIKQEKLIREQETYETEIFSHVSDLVWKLNHKVVLTNDRGKETWVLTFLEKEHPYNLVWKIEKL